MLVKVVATMAAWSVVSTASIVKVSEVAPKFVTPDVDATEGLASTKVPA